MDFTVLPEPKRAPWGCTLRPDRVAPVPSEPVRRELPAEGRTLLLVAVVFEPDPPRRALIELGAVLEEIGRELVPVLRSAERPPRLLGAPEALVVPEPEPREEPLLADERLPRGSRRCGGRTPPKRGVTGRSIVLLPAPEFPSPEPVD